VKTVCFGMAASMGAFLLGAGAKGKRSSLPNARIMVRRWEIGLTEGVRNELLAFQLVP